MTNNTANADNYSEFLFQMRLLNLANMRELETQHAVNEGVDMEHVAQMRKALRDLEILIQKGIVYRLA